MEAPLGSGPIDTDGGTPPERHRELLWRVGPFALAMFLAFAVVPVAHPEARAVPLALACALVVAVAVGAALVPWRRVRGWPRAVPALAAFPIIALLRHAEGGAESAHAPLVTLPLLWLALYATRRQLVAGLVLGAATFALPPLVVGAPGYPATEWTRAAIFAFLAPIATFVIHDLVRRGREQAEVVGTLRARLALTEESFRAAFQHSPTAQFMCAPTGALLRVNDELCTLAGASRDQLFGADTSDLFATEAAVVDDTLLALWEGREPGPVEFEATLETAPDEERFVLVRLDLVRAPDRRPLFLIGHVLDVTARVAAERERDMRADGERAVRTATERLADEPDARRGLCAAAIEVSAARAAVLMELDGSGSLVVTERAGPAGGPAAIEIGRRQSHAATALASHRSVLAAAGDAAADGIVAGAAGARGCALFEPILHEGTAVGVLVVGWDRPRDEVSDEAIVAAHLLAAEAALVIARSERLETLTRLAEEDPLTGLSNRRVWEDQLPRELARSAREGRPLCVAIVDLDHFKAYNDRHGHAAGDRLLLEAAGAWRSRLRRSDMLARYGGEEFAVILPSCAADRALTLLERLREATPDPATCSIGIAEWDGRETAEQLVERADRALYAAKRDGRNRTAVSELPAQAA